MEPIFSDNSSQSSEEFRELLQAKSLKAPDVDLLLPSTAYRCEKCSVFLAKLSRIVARQTAPQKEEGFSNYCVACFVTYSKSSLAIPPESEIPKYQYTVIEAPQTTEDQRSLQNLALFQCVQKFGINSWDKVLNQFTQRTGIKRLEVQLAKRYFSIYEGNDPQLNFRELANPRSIPDSKEGKTRRPPDYFDPQQYPDDGLKKQFDQILKQNSVLNASHYPINNSYEYLLSILTEKITESPNFAMKQEEKYFAAKWMDESQVYIEQQSAALDILRELYVAVFKRQNRGGRRLNISEGDPDYIGEDIEDYLQLKHLNGIPNMPDLLAAVEDLRQKREALKAKQKNLKMAIVTSKQELPKKEETKVKEKKKKKEKKAKKPVKVEVKMQPNVRMTRSSTRF